MKISTKYTGSGTDLDQQAHTAAGQIADKYGLRDRAANTWRAMADELLAAMVPAIQQQVRAEANQAAKDRLKVILDLPEAKDRRAVAERLALETDTPPEQVASILETIPKEQRGPSALARLMRDPSRSPGISSDYCGEPPTDEEEAVAYILGAGQP